MYTDPFDTPEELEPCDVCGECTVNVHDMPWEDGAPIYRICDACHSKDGEIEELNCF